MFFFNLKIIQMSKRQSYNFILILKGNYIYSKLFFLKHMLRSSDFFLNDFKMKKIGAQPYSQGI